MGLVLSKLCAGEVNVIEFVEILLEILGKMSVVKPDLHLPYLSRFSISSTLILEAFLGNTLNWNDICVFRSIFLTF